MQSMMKNARRLILNGSCLSRQMLTTAKPIASPPAVVSLEKPETLYRMFSALGVGAAVEGSVPKPSNDQIVMDGRTYSVKELRKYRRFDCALEIKDWMEDQNMDTCEANCAIELDNIGKTDGIEAAESYFNELSPSDKNQVTVYGALLHRYCKELMSDKALALFQEMDEKKYLDFSLPFNNLMSMYVRSGQPEKVSALFDEMKQRGVSPCSVSYKLLMQSYGCLKDFEAVERVFNDFVNDLGQDNVDWTTFYDLASVYLEAGLFEKADLTLKKSQELMGFRNREDFLIMITRYAATGNLSEVHRLWEMLKSSFDVVSDMSYLVMLDALAKLKDVESVVKCYNEWESNCTSYDRRIGHVVLRVFIDHGMYEDADLIFDKLTKKTRGPFFMAREMFMFSYLKINQLDMAFKYLKDSFSEAKENVWITLQDTVDAIFHHFCKEKDVDGAEKLCNILKDNNHLDSNAYSLLLKTYVAAGKQAPEMRQRLEEDNIEISDELENKLNSVCPK